MWQVLLAAAVTGCGIFGRNLLNSNSITEQTQECEQQQDNNELAKIDEEPKPSFDSPKPQSSIPSTPHSPNANHEEDAIFRFSSLGSRNRNGTRFRSVSKNTRKKSEYKGNVDGFRRGIEVQRFSVCLKRRKTAKNASVKCGSCSSKDNSSFGWGFGVGIMYMVSAGKSEISKLNTAMDETAKVVQELKSELYQRKSSRNLQISSSVSKVDTEPVLTKSSSGNRDPNDITISSLPITDDREYASSVLTEEPEPEVLEMDQLEAELKSELQKIPWCTTKASCHGGITSDFGETEIVAKEVRKAEGQSSNAYESQGVLPSELDQKLSHLLIEQQESQIVELESELQLAHSKLHEKDAELQALKDCVRRLTHFSLSTVSDDENEKHVEQERTCKWDDNSKVEAESKKPTIGMKRVIDFESCDYYME